MPSCRPSIFAIVSLIGLLFTLIPGCTAPRPPRVVTDPDPSVKIPAIELAVQHHDLSVTPQLIKSLDSDDPAVRFYAIEALHRLTGERFGYLYYAGEDQRRVAVRKWQAWQTARSAPGTQP